MPAYVRRFGLGEGLQLGLEARKNAMTDAIARRQLEIERQKADWQREADAGRLGLGFAELGERRAGRMDERDYRGRQLGFSREQLGETRRANVAQEGLAGQRLGLDTDRFADDRTFRNRAQTEEERRNRAAEGLQGQQFGETRRSNLVGEAQRGRSLDLEQRAREEAERSAKARELLEGRQLTEAERANLQREALSRLEIEERKAGRLSDADYRNRQLSQNESQFGRSFGLQERDLSQRRDQFMQELGFKTREQEERERANRVGEGFTGRQLTEAERSNRTREAQADRGFGLDVRRQGEAERSNRVGESQAARRLTMEESRQRFDEADHVLRSAVESKQLEFTQAKTLRDEAYRNALNGQDAYKWLLEFVDKQRTGDRSDATTRRGQDLSHAASINSQREATRRQIIENAKPSNALTYEQRAALYGTYDEKQADRRASRDDEQEFRRLLEKERAGNRLTHSEAAHKLRMEALGYSADRADQRSEYSADRTDDRALFTADEARARQQAGFGQQTSLAQFNQANQNARYGYGQESANYRATERNRSFNRRYRPGEAPAFQPPPAPGQLPLVPTRPNARAAGGARATTATSAAAMQPVTAPVSLQRTPPTTPPDLDQQLAGLSAEDLQSLLDDTSLSPHELAAVQAALTRKAQL